MTPRWSFSRDLAVVEGAAAGLLLVLGVLLLIAGRRAADWAVKTYGHNVDSGAIESAFGTLMLILAVALAFGALSLWFRWRVRIVLQVAIAAAVVWCVRLLA